MAVGLFTSFLTTLFVIISLNTPKPAACYIDVEELAAIQYTIDISDKPLLLEDDDIILSSKHGQQFRCSYQSRLDDARQSIRQHRLNDDTTDGQNITALLQPLADGPCLIHTAHWWTYEYCYKKELRQYHLEDGRIAGDVITLGYYASEFNWYSSEVKATMEMKQRFHSERYENGTNCDITGVGRQATVRFMCESKATSDYILRIEEPATCNYIITIRTARLCASRLLAEPEPKFSVPIVCHPALTEPALEQFAITAAERSLKETQEAQAASGSESLPTIGMYVMSDDGGVPSAGDGGVPSADETHASAMATEHEDRIAANLDSGRQQFVTETQEVAIDERDINGEGEDDVEEFRELNLGGVSVRVRVRRSLPRPTVAPDAAPADAKGSGNVEEMDEEEGGTVDVELTATPGDSNAPPPERIEVKVINAAYYDKDGKPVSKYPQDSSTTLDQMVLAVLQRNDEEKSEFSKQRKLEENYKFYWSAEVPAEDGEED